MSLQIELERFQAEFTRTAPAERVALYERKIEELRESFASRQVLGVGDKAPDFALPDAKGAKVSLAAVLNGGPAIIIFYRGGWCPYCNIQLRAYQAVLPEIASLGGRVIAISPQAADATLSTAEKNELAFDVLSDVGNGVAREFGLVYSLPDELRAALTAAGKALPGMNGDESWELPVPATFVVAQDRTVALAGVEVDYRKRSSPEDVIAALRLLRSSLTSAA